MPELHPEAYSEDGFIIDQSKTGAMPYGKMPSDYNGCGWIAVYNLYRLIGRPHSAAALSAGLAAGSPFNARLGTGPRRLRRYLEAQGLPVKTAARRKTALALAGQARAGILFYFAKYEPHYVAFSVRPDGRLRFFNADAGRQQHVGTLAEFFKTNAKHMPIYMMALPKDAAGHKGGEDG